MNKPINELLTKQLKQQGITRAEFAQQMGVDNSTASRWVSGSIDPPPDRWHQIETVLGLPGNSIAVATGHITPEGNVYDLTPEAIGYAVDVSLLTDADREMVLDMVRRLRQ